MIIKAAKALVGELHVEIIKIDVNAKAQFGYKSEGMSEATFIFIDGMVDFSPVEFFGHRPGHVWIGGGVYYNMTAGRPGIPAIRLQEHKSMIPMMFQL
ncbi:MAG: hypothetical protein IPK46_08745 [Saprospiraceae bacterium]|nr:hypothetical protein [Saprospiraceae bacterium]